MNVKSIIKLISIFLGIGLLSPVLAAEPGSLAVSAGQPHCPALLQHTLPRLQDEKPQSLCQYAGKVALVVNTASYCGFTPQYAELERLQQQLGARGLVVLGFPSNDFAQEQGSNRDIADFCANTFGVKFPMFTKTSVTGGLAHPLYQQLARQSGQRPAWNFHKYLISRDGRRVLSFASSVSPDSPELRQAVLAELAKP
jgi:glutathione peroxidase